MSDEEKASSRYNKNIRPIFNKEHSKSELLVQLRKIGYDTTKKRYLKPELIMIAKEKKYLQGKMQLK